MVRKWILVCVFMAFAGGAASAQMASMAMEPLDVADGASLLQRPAHLFVEDVTLGTALARLTEASGVPMAYSPSLVGADRRTVGCDCRDATVGQALERLLARSAFSFREMRGEVLVYLAVSPPVVRDDDIVFRKASFTGPSAPTLGSPWPREQAVGSIVGSVVDATTMRPLADVQVAVVGARLGGLSNASGRFQIRNVPAGEQVLRAVLIGYGAVEQRVTVLDGQATSVNISMTQTAVALEGIVVTALGIERQERTLTTSVQQVRADDIAQVPDPNLVAALSGKVSGVNIFNSNTAGGSSRIVIRGANSLTGSNQPLFVVDGVPVSNSVGSGVFGSRGYAAIDYGNAIQDINPNDIQSVSVLKGPNAAALYGSRAANGVILITTKSGRTIPRSGLQVTATNTLTFERPLKLPQYQNLYGQGYNGRYTYVDGKGNGTYDDYDESWGPRLDMGLMIPQFFSDGQAAPWVSHPDNVNDFFETGMTRNTAAAFSAATDNASFRMSVANFNQDGMLPGFELGRTTIGLNAVGGITDRIQAQGSVQYFNVDGNNRPAQGYSSDNPMFGFVWFGRQVDTHLLKAKQYNADGTQFNWNSIWNNNPYWVMLINRNWDTRDRVVGNISLSYQLTPWLSAMVRTGTDWSEDFRKRTFAAGTYGQSGVDENGAFAEGTAYQQETNSDFLLSVAPRAYGDFTIGGNAGGNRRDNSYRSHDVYVRDLVVPGLYDLGNAAVTPALGDWREQTRTNSLYAAVQLGWRDLLFVDVTGRNDWSSTLPEDNNSYFYPSVSTGLVFSDLVKVPGLSYGKLRAGWAEVGNDASAYQLIDPYVAGQPFGNVPLYSASNTLRNFDLKPERTKAWEVGGELDFVEGRVGLDLTYYRKRTSNQIVPAQVSALTGFTSRMVNAGTIRNSGVELLAKVTPVRLDNGFEWELSATWTKNNSMVEDLYADLEQIVLDEYYNVQVVAKKGEPYGQMYGRMYVRDPDGNIVVGSNGLPLNTASNPLGVLGNYNPDWTAGLGTRLSYGPLSANVLFDVRQGGSIYSVMTRYGYRSGVLIETLQGREQADGNGAPIGTADGGGLIVDGVKMVISGGDTTYVPNDIRVTAQSYWKLVGNGLSEAIVRDASFVKLREVRLGWEVPESITDRLRLASAELAVIGRNLFLWTDVRHIDPETSLNSGNAQGYEYGQMPSARSFGFSISVAPRSSRRPSTPFGN